MAQQQTEENEPIKLDFSGLKEELKNVFKEAYQEQIRMIQENLKLAPQPTGNTYQTPPDQSKRLLESFKDVASDKWTMKEQWTVAIPNYTANEPKAHLRDFVWVQELLKTEQGDIANIPYVMDFTFEQLGSVGNAFSATLPEASLIGYVSTVLYEAGRYTDLSYYLLERFDSNLLDLCNKAFADAAVRSEDAKIMTLVNTPASGTMYAGNVTRCTAAAYFYSTNIPAALKILLSKGKAVKPTECLLYLTANAYGALLAEMTTSQVIAFAQPAVITQGMIEALFGVKIVVGGYTPSKPRKGAATGTVDVCFLMRPKRAIALAPKRDILIETQKQIATRKLRITASHTFGIKILDYHEIVRIWTSKSEA